MRPLWLRPEQHLDGFGFINLFIFMMSLSAQPEQPVHSKAAVAALRAMSEGWKCLKCLFNGWLVWIHFAVVGLVGGMCLV